MWHSDYGHIRQKNRRLDRKKERKVNENMISPKNEHNSFLKNYFHTYIMLNICLTFLQISFARHLSSISNSYLIQPIFVGWVHTSRSSRGLPWSTLIYWKIKIYEQLIDIKPLKNGRNSWEVGIPCLDMLDQSREICSLQMLSFLSYSRSFWPP